MKYFFSPSPSDAVRFSTPGSLGLQFKPETDDMLTDHLLSVRNQAGPIGLDDHNALQSNNSKHKGSKKSKGTRTITVYADFDNPWKGNLSAEIQRMKDSAWEPHEVDFDVVSKGGTPISSYDQMFGLIVMAPKGSVKRVNVFTHANKDLIAFSGTLKPKATFTEVNLNIPGSINDQEIAAWPSKVYELVGSQTSDGKTKFTIADVQARFSEDAEIILFACHSGVDAKFLKDIGKGMGANARGFSKNIAYCPTFTTNPPTINRNRLAIQNCSGQKVTDFEQLTPDRP